MPAVSIARLKAEVAGLSDLFARPAEFRQGLHHLLDFYADRVYKAGQNIPPPPLIPTYHAPPLVIQQLQLELRARCLEDPAAGLALADELWHDPYLEVRKLAVFMLGQVPPEPPQPVVQRIEDWANPDEPAEILKVLLSEGTGRLRREMPVKWLDMIQTWVDSATPGIQFLGFQALAGLVEDNQFTNFPPVYRMISPFLHMSRPLIQPTLQHVLESLARRSPMETVYFLRQILGSPTPPGTIRIVRRLMPLFDPDTQNSLRKMLLARP